MRKLLLAWMIGMMGFTAFGYNLDNGIKPPECDKPWGATTQDSLLNVKRYFFYQSSLEAKKFNEAYKYWQLVVNNIPCARQTPYASAKEMMDTLMAHEGDEARKVRLRDSVYWSYQQWIKYFGQEGYIKGRWGLTIREYEPMNRKKAFEVLSSAVDLMGNKTDYDVPYDMMLCSYYLYKGKQRTIDESINDYIKVSDICSYNITSGKEEEKETWQTVSAYLDNLASKLLTCEKVVEVFGPKLKSEPENLAMRMTVVKLMKALKCLENPMYISTLTEVIEKEPSEAGYAELSNYYKNKGDLSKSNEYLEKAAGLTDDNARKEDYYLRIAAGSLSSSCSKAREYADKVLELNPNNGNAIILKGHAVYRCAKGSAENTFWKQCLSWVAVDYMARAKSLDPSVAETADNAIASYRKGYPSKEDMFLRNIKPGDTVNIKNTGLSAVARL